MPQRRRNIIRAAGIALTAGLAGCSSTSDGQDTQPTETEASVADTGGYGGDPTTTSNTETTNSPETTTATEQQTEASLSGLRVVLDNVGIRAWEVLSDESGSVAPLDQENPAMTFETGQRYVIENRGWSAHPFALRASDDTPLLSQSAAGRYEDDSVVGWVDNEETLAFTFTEELAADVDYYICTVHPGMRGDVTTR